jgi:hypothetical protein
VIEARKKKDTRAKKGADRRRADRRRSNTAKVETRVAKYEADRVAEHAQLLDALTELTTNKLALAAAEAQAKVSTAAASGLGEKIGALRHTNKQLNLRVLELDNKVGMLEDSLEEAAAVGDQTDADDYIDRIGGSDGKKVRARQHPFKTRLAIFQMLAIGVLPANVVFALSSNGATTRCWRARPRSMQWLSTSLICRGAPSKTRSMSSCRS